MPHFAGRRFDAGRVDVHLVGVAKAADADLAVRIDFEQLRGFLGRILRMVVSM